MKHSFDSLPAPHAIGREPMPLPPLSPKPLVSVLISNYNYAAYIGAALDSVLAQTYQTIELVVCDDGSTDGSREIISRYAAADRRITALFKPNGGQPSGWNMAWPECRGEIVCVLDADDIFAPEKIARVVTAMQQSNCGLLIHALTVTDAAGAPIQRMPFLTTFEHGFIAEKVMRRGGRWRYMSSSALCFRREIGNCIFPIPEDLFRGHADSMVVGLAPLLAPVDALDDCLGAYRVHGRNTIGGDFHDLNSARKVVACTGQMAEGVNLRLREMGAQVRLNCEQNLELLQARYVVELLEGRPLLQLLHHWRKLMRALWADDLYGMTQKVLGSLAYHTAALLPLRWRGRWIEMTLGYSRLKAVVQACLRPVKRLARAPGNVRRETPGASVSPPVTQCWAAHAAPLGTCAGIRPATQRPH